MENLCRLCSKPVLNALGDDHPECWMKINKVTETSKIHMQRLHIAIYCKAHNTTPVLLARKLGVAMTSTLEDDGSPKSQCWSMNISELTDFMKLIGYKPNESGN